MTKEKFSAKEWRRVFDKYSNLGYPSEDDLIGGELDESDKKPPLGIDELSRTSAFNLISPLGHDSSLPPNNTKASVAVDLRSKNLFSLY